MRFVTYNQPVALDHEGEVFRLPLRHTYLKWGGLNYSFGHLFSLVDEYGDRVLSEPMTAPFDTRLLRLSENQFLIVNHFEGPKVILQVKEDGGRYLMTVMAEPQEQSTVPPSVTVRISR